MSRYQLRGLVLPSRSRPTFLIPYFGQRSSNEIFAQDLGPGFLVARFLPFEPTHFEEFAGPVPVLERDIGMDGLLACLDGEGRLTLGSVDEMRRLLARFELDPAGGDAFFATELMELRGDRAGLARAIEAAASRFSDPERGRRWRNREAGMGAAGQDGPAARQDASLVEVLRKAFGDDDWPSLFRANWSTHDNQIELVELALEWLRTAGARSPQAGKLLLFLLPTSGKLRRERPSLGMFIPGIIDAAEAWLCDLPPTAPQWAALWGRVLRHRDGAEPRLVELGLRLLRDERLNAPGNGSRGMRQIWLNVWRTLWKRSDGHRAELITALMSRSDQFLVQPTFEKILLPLLDEHDMQQWAREQLTTWLDLAPRFSNGWAKVCAALVSRFGEDPRLVELALDWLWKDGVKLNAWRELWSQLHPFAPQNILKDTARHWLELAPYVMRSWPVVLAHLIRADAPPSSPIIREQADRWLGLGRSHADRELIENFVLQARAQFPQGSQDAKRVYLIYHHERDQWRAAVVRNRLFSVSGIRPPQSDLSEWQELQREGERAIAEYIRSEMREASVAIVLLGSETSNRRWIDFEIVRAHEQGLGMLAIDVSGIPDASGSTAPHGGNPLTLWQGELNDGRHPLSDIYRTYDWIEDDGPSNLSAWIDEAAHDAEVRSRRQSGSQPA